MVTARNFDRSIDDVGNILCMEHVNVTVPDQTLATYFYVNGLGFTRDPYIDFGPFNVWINVGSQQFHLPTNKPQVLRGHTGVVVPDLDALEKRLTSVSTKLKDTKFAFSRTRESISVTCPWGNLIKCHAPGKFGNMKLGIPYVEFDVPVGTCPGITRFYEKVFNCTTTLRKTSCEINVGRGQTLRFRESKKKVDYDGHHIAIYVVNFSEPHSYLKKKNLITEESDAHQYRFLTIIDPKSGKKLFDIEHEVRSLHHPMYERFLVNRNAAQTFFNYQQGRDVFVP
jgi:catechol-2,3-dioxygenase